MLENVYYNLLFCKQRKDFNGEVNVYEPTLPTTTNKQHRH